MSGGLIRPPEAPVRDWLDGLGVPFRAPAAELAAAHGTRPPAPGASAGSCVLPGKPFAPGATPFAFPLWPGADHGLPPLWLEARLGTARRGPADLIADRRAERNLAAALAALVPRFGEGAEASLSDTRARRWDFGMARILAACFPPRLDRHRAGPPDPAARVTVWPGWLPPPDPRARAWLARFRRIGPAMPPPLGPHLPPARWHRLGPAEGPPAAQGFGVSADGQGLVVVAGDLFLAVPRDHIRALRRDLSTPARGPGSVELLVLHAPPDPAVTLPHRLYLLRVPYGPDALRAEAQALAGALGLPLEETEGPDG